MSEREWRGPELTRSIDIREMRRADAESVARLHAETITEGFLSGLGLRFLTQMYVGVAGDSGSHVWVAEEDGTILGFCSYARDVGAMYKRILRRRWLRFLVASVPKSLNPFVVKEMVDTLRYPVKQSGHSLPPAEILSIGVSDRARGTGVGKRLLTKAIDQARADGEKKVKVLAGAGLATANRFYEQAGFTKLTEIRQHGEPLNVYVMDLDQPSSDSPVA